MHEPRHAVSKTVEMSSTESMAVYCACVAVQRNSCALMKQKYSLMDVARYACSYRSPCHSMALRPCLLRRPYKAHRTNDHGIAQRPLDQVASMSTSDATAAVHELVLAMQEALLCGARATDTDATGALTEMHNRSLHAEQCIHNIKDAMMNSLSSAADVGSSTMEERRDHLREEAYSKNKQLKAVIDHLRSVLSAVDGWNADVAPK